MATSSDDIDMAHEALDLADSWGSMDLDAGQIKELARALRDAWRLGRTSANVPRDADGRVVTDLKARLDEATRLLGLATKDYDAHAVAAEELRGTGCHGENTVKVMADAARLLGERAVVLDAHAECAEELGAVGCRGETTTAVMTHAVERIKRADAAEAEGNRVIEALAKRADGEAEDAREAIATLQNELGEAIATLRSLRDELRETNVLRRDSHSRLQAVRDAVRED